MATFLLVHPPLLGPAVWHPVARELRSQGHAVIVPDLRDGVTQADDWWGRWAETCAEALQHEAPTVVAGHSGSGVALPAIVSGHHPQAVVFVDALVPARTGATTPGDEIRDFTSRLARDGRLPAWSTWWPPDELAQLVPDAALRSAALTEAPELPADFYEVAVPVPPGWDENVGLHYLQLSPAYAAAAAEAVARNWSVTVMTGGHLHLINRPDAVAEVLVAAAG